MNYDNDITREMAGRVNGKLRLFSTKVKLEDGVIIDNEMIKVSKGKIRKQIINIDDILLLGAHNVENACTAIAAVYDISRTKCERCMRVAVDAVFENSDYSVIKEVFGRPLKSKPTNSEFLACLYEYLRYER